MLTWPEETISSGNETPKWYHAGSNLCLDFHGNPLTAKLVVFSDGNHHMALIDCLKMFLQQNNELSEIFYATTPPGPIVNMLRNGGLQMGNLVISVYPHVFISPPEVLDRLVADSYMSGHIPFVQNQGNVLLVKKGNPKHIFKISDIARGDIQLFLSNPDSEKASFATYYKTLKDLALEQTVNPDFVDEKITKGQVLFGKCIHHREAPQAVAEGSADVAVVFYHLALRYLRIFPDLFDAIPLGGSIDKPKPSPGNIINKTHMGLVGDGGMWGPKLIAFLNSKLTKEIYHHHGLQSL